MSLRKKMKKKMSTFKKKLYIHKESREWNRNHNGSQNKRKVENRNKENIYT